MLRRNLIVVCLFMVSFCPSLKAQRRMSGSSSAMMPRGQEIAPKVPRGAFDVLAFKGSTPSIVGDADSTRMDLYIAIPYSALEFLYAVDNYVADYSVALTVTDKERVLFDRYESYTVLETTAEHQARVERSSDREGRADAEQISFLMVPGKDYEMRLSVRDFSSRREFDTTIDFYAKNFSASAPGISDLMIYRERNGMRIVPSIGADVSELTGNGSSHASMSDHAEASIAGNAGLFAELYNLPADSTLGVVTEIVQDQNGENPAEPIVAFRATSILPFAHVDKQGFTAPATVAETPLFIPLQFDPLSSGHYSVRTFILPSVHDTNITELAALAHRAILGAERNIFVRIARGIPSSVNDLDQAIDQLRIIATGAEWDSLSNAKTAKEKRDAITAFWNQKSSENAAGNMASDGNRPMEVFYARVEYVNTHFSGGVSQGWKSDRGRVYIALGSPDAIDSHPDEMMQKPYEIWEYTGLNARYTFVDEYMLGDYRLRGPLPPPGTFIWNR